ncbi:MAG: PorT family protein [Bacteroidales bacterium]|nr:PorT family protein [Bacteroidales bacterium]MCF8387581.1 PorT family protein [Bacteroidales bacterium]MCF8397029.1 PorT family protein [Bacteroidales bacterium]
MRLHKIFGIALLLLFLIAHAHAQIFKGAAIGGFNLTQVDGDEVYGFNRIGLNAGAGVVLPLGEHWEISLETSFSQKGAYQKQQYIDSSRALTGEYNLRLNYVEVPLLLHYKDKGGLTFGAGLSWGRLVSSKEIEHGDEEIAYSDSIPFNDNDFSVIADIRFRIWKNLHGNFRYSYSLQSIRERTFYSLDKSNSWTRKQYNNVLTFRIIYIIDLLKF